VVELRWEQIEGCSGCGLLNERRLEGKTSARSKVLIGVGLMVSDCCMSQLSVSLAIRSVMEGMRQLETAEEETRQGRSTKKSRIAIVISRKGAKDCLLRDFCHQESFVSEHQALLLLLGRATLSAGGALVPSSPPELPTIRKAEKLH
jgi:hypothetical protein